MRVPLTEELDSIRRSRMLPAGAKWVVCSAGGGKNGEDLIESCWQLSQLYPELYFDIVTGPRSRLQFSRRCVAHGRVSVVDANHAALPAMHAAADIVITRGGYNSLIEACVAAQGSSSLRSRGTMSRRTTPAACSLTGACDCVRPGHAG